MTEQTPAQQMGLKEGDVVRSIQSRRSFRLHYDDGTDSPIFLASPGAPGEWELPLKSVEPVRPDAEESQQAPGESYVTLRLQVPGSVTASELLEAMARIQARNLEID